MSPETTKKMSKSPKANKKTKMTLHFFKQKKIFLLKKENLFIF